MKSRARILVLCLLCVARASIVLPSEDITELKARSAVQDLSKQESNGIDEQAADKLRDKRALGLLLSGLAQIFGYTVTPIQIATLANPNTTIPAAMSSMRQPQVVSSRPTNTMAPRQRETIRFTGVLNFGNNSDILGHLQRYEQTFHGSRNNATTITTLRPPPKPTPPAQVAFNPTTKPPLLAPFFVKIPLPIAPELLPAAIPEDLTLSYPAPAITIVSGSNENAELPIRQKEQEAVYKPASKNTQHQLFINEPSGNKQRNRHDERKQEANRENPTHCDETKERYKDREEQVDNRNRQHASKYKPTEKKRPDEADDSAESYEEREDESKSSRGSSRQPPEKNNEDKDYRDGNDEGDKQFDGYQQPENLNKYIEAGYNQQLPIGDYFHDGNPDVIRDSYGEVLDNKKLEEDKLAEYINMFKHPYTSVHASSQEASGEDGSSADGYDEHLARLQKLRAEYAPPENKYEEYDLNDERKADRNDRRSEKNRTSTGSRRPKTSRLNGKKEDDRIKSIISNDSEVVRNGAAKSGAQQEVDFRKYTPLIVPVRYIDVNDKVQQATTQQLNIKEIKKFENNQFAENKMGPVTTLKEKLPLQIIFPKKTQQLLEGEYEKFQVSPPPFDYTYDNTQPANIFVPANLENYPRNRHIEESNVEHNDANNDESSEDKNNRSGYLAVIGEPVVYQYPQNNYYYSNEATNPQNQAFHLSTEGTHPQNRIYVPQLSGNRQFIQANPNLTDYNLNETTKNSYNYYYQPQEIPDNVLDRYRYIFREQALQAEQSSNIDVRSQFPDAENWSNRIYRPQSQGEQSFSSLPQLQNVAASNYNAQRRPLEKPRDVPGRQKPEAQRESNGKISKIPLRQSVPKNFEDPQTAHDFFGFSKDDYSFRYESNGGSPSKVAEENGKTAKESHVFISPEPVTDHYDDESIAKDIGELENNPEKATVKEYRNRVATLRVSEQRQSTPNGPIHYVDYIRNI